MVLETPIVFDDYHHLAKLDFQGMRLVIFEGMSGSGKTTAIEYLCREHPQFRDCHPRILRLARPHCRLHAIRDELVVLDDVRWLQQLLAVAQLLQSGNTVLVASHLSSRWFLPLACLWKSRWFVMDRDQAKIERYLTRRQVTFTQQAVVRYCQVFGANYADVDLILEHCPAQNFDAALGYFLKFCRRELSPNPDHATTGEHLAE